MQTHLRRFLLLLVMLALPLQSYASAAMLACAAPHRAAPAQMVMADEAMAGCHEPEQAPPVSHNCKHCTVCALASALPIPSTDVVGWVAASPGFLPPSDVTFSGFIPDGPERPPRTPLA